MALVDHWITNTLNCVSVESNASTPTTGTAGSSVSFSNNIVHTQGATISTVKVLWGDGSAEENLTAGTPATANGVTTTPYTGTHTFSTAGKYAIRVTTTLASGETDYELYTITIS